MSKSQITLDPAQRRFFLDESRVQVVCWHRQKGKDFVTAAKAVFDAMKSGESWFIVSLTQRQADATFEKCRFWASYYRDRIKGQVRERVTEYEEYDAQIDELFTLKAREILLPNGGRVVSLPGKDPDKLAGLTGNVIFTEFGLFPNGGYEHWRVVFPLATRGFRVIVISTPRSKSSKFHELVHDPDTYSVHFCDIHTSIAEGFVLKDQDGQPCTLEVFKKLYGDDIGFEREYECKFTGDLAALIAWALLEQAAARGAARPFSLLRIEHDAGWDATFFNPLRAIKGRDEVGWDVARHGHFSVIWVNTGPVGDKHLTALVLMQHTSFGLQREVVSAAMTNKPGNVGAGDATGIGADSNETLERRYPKRWEGVNFAGTRKSDLGSGLFTAFRDSTQSLPAFDGPSEAKFVATDIYAVQRQLDQERQTDEQGKARLKLTETPNALLPDSHCDIAYAGALAIRAGHMPVAAEPKMTRLL